jgi:hypothetical protein
VTFVHEDAEFADLVRIVAANTQLTRGLIEKDYWVTHTLWALRELGLEVWFKGGTSLSKGFGLIQRFSEDLDLKLEPGSVAEIPHVRSWKNEKKGATDERLAYFEALERSLRVPGADAVLDREQADRAHRSALYRVRYPGAFLDDLGGLLRPFVLLEVGSARVTPFVERDLSSFVHDHLEQLGSLGEFADNRPRHVRCVHPLVTLLEKLDAVTRRFPRAVTDAAGFVRHYEDAARIISGLDALPPLEVSARGLAEEMVREKQVRGLVSPRDPALEPGSGEAWDALRRAHADIQMMFWGERLELEAACEQIRGWTATTLG